MRGTGALARPMKRVLKWSVRVVVVTRFNGDYVGYVIPAKYYRLDGYEPRTMSFFGPQLPECFMAVLGELTAALADR